MRILELINSLDTGGAERVVTNLALDMQARGHSVHIICLRDLGVTPVPVSELVACGLRISTLVKSDGFSRAAVSELAAYMRHEGIDIVHSHNPPVSHYALLAAKLARVPVIVNTVHGTATLSMRPIGRVLYGMSCLFTTRVVSVCRAVEKVSRRRIPLWGGRSTVIYNGIDVNPFLWIPRRGRNGKIRFGTVGRFVPVKDHRSLLEAFASVHAAKPESELHLLGWGELEEELRRQAQNLGILQAVYFHGFSREVPKFLANLDCFVMSSRSEGLPMAVLEAMAAGLPIISTAVGGIPELIEQSGCGWLSPPGAPDELARCMMQAIESDDLVMRGERARQSAIANYSVSRMSDEYLNLFRDLLNSNGTCH